MKQLTQEDIYKLVILKVLNLKTSDYPASILKKAYDLISHRSINRRSFYSAVTKAKNEGLIEIVEKQDKLIFYSMTGKGREVYKSYSKSFTPSMEAVKTVVSRLEHVLKKENLHPKIAPILDAEHRPFFSRLFSAKDVIRYYTLKRLLIQRKLYMAEISELLEQELGWTPSIGYLYDIAHEMEEGSLIIGRWDNDVRRNKRFYQLTDEGAHHFKQIEQSTFDQTLQHKKYLGECLQLMEEIKY
ncbi:PadR family transcriptional regulator [Salipaludibacillus daqingensis]|uniref:PadR family transcriptional regulator n=1 Tax=Salipaludibacillus daqingensis TaxID=3041001 RepID=UPI002476B23A|nr:helix-turn-helix transcriptional regulator [Salipaludibacillus daqingensis]